MQRNPPGLSGSGDPGSGDNGDGFDDMWSYPDPQPPAQNEEQDEEEEEVKEVPDEESMDPCARMVEVMVNTASRASSSSSLPFTEGSGPIALVLP